MTHSNGGFMYRSALWTLPLLLLLPACSRKAEGQSVAVVNNEEITTTELNSELKSANLPANAAGDARARLVEGLVDRRLLAQQAKADGLDKSPDFLNQQMRMNENLLINMMVLRRLNTMPLPSAEEVTKFEAEHPEMFSKRELWTLQQIQYQTPKDPATSEKIANSKTLQQLSQVLSASGVQLQPHTSKVDTAIFPHDIYNKVAGLPAGEPFIIPGGDRSVASVIVSRESSPQSMEQTRATALDSMRRGQAAKILTDLVASAKAHAKIQYQRGFEPSAQK